MIREVPSSLRECLERNQLAMGDVDYFVFHQASRFLLETLRQQLRLPPEKVPIALAETGNTISSTIPNILAGMIQEGRTNGKKVLISGFGVGLSWATNTLFFDPVT
jgi:3-oxoacyl-[acyl-carrier-protein] synthase-3